MENTLTTLSKSHSLIFVQFRDFFDISTRNESFFARTSDDQCASVFVRHLTDLTKGLSHFIQNRRVQCIQSFRTIDGKNPNAVWFLFK
ncbi:hypothetical protein D3C72_1573010 [compost metagenome]